MCLAVPVKIIERIDDTTVMVESRGVKLHANTMLVNDVLPGEYALIHAGFIIEKISKGSAKELLEFYGEME
jgi:hydrogenase expression/formation protein HypC